MEQQVNSTTPELLFEARLPNGQVFRVFEDGRCEGFEHGTIIQNHFGRLLRYERGLRIQALKKARVSDGETTNGVP